MVPAAINDAVLFRISKEMRRPAERLVPVCVVALFFFAAILFSDLTRAGYISSMRSNLGEGTLLVVVGILAVIGGTSCIVPFWAMSKLLPLREGGSAIGSLDHRAIYLINLLGKTFGVLFILTSSFLARSLFG